MGDYRGKAIRIGTGKYHAINRERNILQSLYELYVKHEYLKVDTWEDIEALLDEFVRRQSGEAA